VKQPLGTALHASLLCIALERQHCLPSCLSFCLSDLLGWLSACLGLGVEVVVGTPGRLQDHLEKKHLKLGACQFVVLDEADEMLVRVCVQADSCVPFCTP
jgi:hypothetical protein